MKQYLLAVHHDYAAPALPDEEVQAMFDRTDRVNTELQGAGVWVFGGGLLSPDNTTVVRTGTGSTTMTDGPYAETKEQLGGFWVIRCAHLDEALTWAERCSVACGSPVEVRPFDNESV